MILTTSWPGQRFPGEAGSCWWVRGACTTARPQPRQEALERAAVRRVRRRPSWSILQPQAPQSSSGAPCPDRSHPGPGRYRSTRRARRPCESHPHSRGRFGKSRPHVRPELTQLSNSDVAVHWVLVDSARLDLGTLAPARTSGATEWHLHSPNRPAPVKLRRRRLPSWHRPALSRVVEARARYDNRQLRL